jgi:palmitoyltransferase
MQFTTYCSLYCAVALASAAYCLALQVQDVGVPDGRVIAVIALAAFFGLFTFMMSATSARFILTNITNVDMLRKAWVYQLAIRVPTGTPSTEKYHTITYPLPRANTVQQELRLPSGGGHTASLGAAVLGNSSSARDRLASRTFAILRAEPKENPWDLGWKKNWETVMGTNIIDWLLPVRRSPCALHEDTESDYKVGPLIAELKARYGLGDLREAQGSVELGNMARR